MKKYLSILTACVCVLALIFLARRTNYAILQRDGYEEDVYYAYLEGVRIERGENPYDRILESDMRDNNKYPTYFPLFYEASYLSVHLGLERFVDWLRFWRQVFNGFDYAVAILLFAVLARKRLEWGGVAAAGFWLFNRWTLYVIVTSNLDFIPIFFMLAAFVLYPKKNMLALLLFSFSLALKQIGILVAPLFVIWAYLAEERRRDSLLQAVKSTAIIASFPFIASLPFLIWNPESFLRSIAFSATRLPETHMTIPSIDQLLDWEGLPARIPMVVLFLAVYWMAARGIGGKYLPAVLVFTVFICFNSVLFNQYFTWLFPLIPLLIAETIRRTASPLPPSPA